MKFVREFFAERQRLAQRVADLERHISDRRGAIETMLEGTGDLHDSLPEKLSKAEGETSSLTKLLASAKKALSEYDAAGVKRVDGSLRGAIRTFREEVVAELKGILRDRIKKDAAEGLDKVGAAIFEERFSVAADYSAPLVAESNRHGPVARLDDFNGDPARYIAATPLILAELTNLAQRLVLVRAARAESRLPSPAEMKQTETDDGTRVSAKKVIPGYVSPRSPESEQQQYESEMENWRRMEKLVMRDPATLGYTHPDESREMRREEERVMAALLKRAA